MNEERLIISRAMARWVPGLIQWAALMVPDEDFRLEDIALDREVIAVLQQRLTDLHLLLESLVLANYASTNDDVALDLTRGLHALPSLCDVSAAVRIDVLAAYRVGLAMLAQCARPWIEEELATYEY